jgi:hypothetical protein
LIRSVLSTFASFVWSPIAIVPFDVNPPRVCGPTVVLIVVVDRLHEHDDFELERCARRERVRVLH